MHLARNCAMHRATTCARLAESADQLAKDRSEKLCELLVLSLEIVLKAIVSSDSGMGIKKQKIYAHICIGGNGTTK